MILKFQKYQGTGNDFILVDDRGRNFPSNRSDIVTWLCDRKLGVGADGLMLIQEHPELDFNMVFFNPDGSKSLCGNGSRCAIAFAQSLGLAGEKTTFETTDGVHEGFVKDTTYYFHLHDVEKVKSVSKGYYIDTGSPHHIQFEESVDDLDVVALGSEIRYSASYAPKGTNVNFVETLEDHIKVRTYERGVENETLSCGTGVTACALAAGIESYKSPVRIRTKGGELSVSFTQKDDNRFTDIYLAGPAKKVFEGEIQLPL